MIQQNKFPWFDTMAQQIDKHEHHRLVKFGILLKNSKNPKFNKL